MSIRIQENLTYRRNLIRILLCCFANACWANSAVAAVKLPSIIGDNMVLQSGTSVPIWGWADKGEVVTVTFNEQTHATTAGEDGRWKVVLATLGAGGPFAMIVKGSSGSTIVLKNVLVGEVWLASGQSNMAMTVADAKAGKQEVAAANHPTIRLFLVGRQKANAPAANCGGAWTECNPASASAFSAVAYNFGHELQKVLQTPVGLINASWYGCPAEAWVSRKSLEANASLKPMAGQGESSVLYNGMLAPLIPYAIRGTIWYQGEANVERAFQYRSLFPAMIANWRSDWGQSEFPFGFVQLAPFHYYWHSPLFWPELCEAQRLTLDSSPNTGMVVTTDLGDLKDIHPKNKKEIGRRLTLWALAKVYGRGLAYSGPLYKSMSIEGARVRLQFDHVAGGLIASDNKPLREFVIAGVDQTFLPATAQIDGDSIIVQSDQISQPVAVRFAWRDEAQPNLVNKANLPASPFRTDAWKGLTEP
jgi:sialate O-acetylesterase